jgi:predicted enzyme related to lactoylglutathione lyase
MEFYNNLLGIKQIQSQVDNPAITWLQLDNGVMVHLIETDEAPAKPGNIHHAFQVDNLEDTQATLESNGFEVLRGGIRYDGQAYFFIQDPDGNSVEFCTASGYAPAPPRPA